MRGVTFTADARPAPPEFEDFRRAARPTGASPEAVAPQRLAPIPTEFRGLRGGMGDAAHERA